MKKEFISVVAVGVALSLTSAFAEDVQAIQPINALTVDAVPTLYTTSQNVSTSLPVKEKEVVEPTFSMPSNVVPVTERSEVIGAKSLERIQARGAQLIKERVTSLNQNAKAVADSKQLTAEQKVAFAAFFSGKIAELTTLGGKIASSTDATSTKVLVQSITTDFRIYAVVLPQVRIQKRIYEMQNHIAKLSETFTKIQSRIDQEKAAGKDVTVWQKSLDDAKILVATDTEKLSALMVQISAMKPSDYQATSTATIKTVNKGIQMIAKDINSIGKKVRKPSGMKRMNVVKEDISSKKEEVKGVR